MLPFNHDASALRAVLAADFEAIALKFKLQSQVEQIVEVLVDSARRILLDQLWMWNNKHGNNPVSKLPAELLASCFAFLPIRDCMAASHVSRAWREAALHCPAVWSYIDISEGNCDRTALLALALQRSGQAPVDLTWRTKLECPIDPDSWLPLSLHRQLHRLRTIELEYDIYAVLDDAMPLLERIDSYSISLSARFLELSGQFGRLHTLHARKCFFPLNFVGFIDSVRDFAASLRLEDDTSHVGLLPHLFARFPRMVSLSLTDIDESHIRWMPRGRAPVSLARLLLSGLAIEAPLADDLVALYQEWHTPQLKEVQLACSPTSLQDEFASRRVRQFFAGAVELSLVDRAAMSNIHLYNQIDLVSVTVYALVKLTSKDADGRTRVWGFNEGGMPQDPGPHELLSRAIWFSIGNAYALLRSVELAAKELDALITLGSSTGFPSVESLGVYLEQIEFDGRCEDAHGICTATWCSLAVLGRLPIAFPALASCFLDPMIRPWGGRDHRLVACARTLIAQIVMHAVPGLPVLNVRGFSREVIQALNPRDFEQFPVRIEFDLSQK